MFGARKLFVRLHGIDQARVDATLALALAIEIELQVWLTPGIAHRPAATIGGAVLSGAVAIRRRWPLAALLLGVGAVVTQDIFGGELGQHAIGSIVAGILLFYGAGAFLEERRARLALVLGIAGLWVDVLITTRAPSDLFFDSVMVGLLPWAMARVIRERAARERSHRETAERLDAETRAGCPGGGIGRALADR